MTERNPLRIIKAAKEYILEAQPEDPAISILELDILRQAVEGTLERDYEGANGNYKIFTENFGGNFHETSLQINSLGWAEFLIQMHRAGNYTICVFKMPAAMVNDIKSDKASYVGDPHEDDYQG